MAQDSVPPTAKNYFTAFLIGLGLPVTQANLDALYGVATAEGWNDRYNPLNVVQQEPGSTAFNSVGVQTYPNLNEGVQGAVQLFKGQNWDGVRAALAQGNSTQAVLAAFKNAYFWAPGISFSPGSATDGDKMIGPSAGQIQTGPVADVASADTSGGTTSVNALADFKFPGQSLITGTLKDLGKITGLALPGVGQIAGAPFGTIKTVTQGLEGIGKSLSAIAAVFSAALWLTQPSSWLRIGSFLVGLLALGIGGYLLATSR